MALSAKPDMKVSPTDPDDDNDGDGDMARAGSGGVIKTLAALVGLTLLAGGIWIGFGDRIMDILSPADGDVPVIAADPSPIKVRPENPGGMQVPNQGRLVYGVVDGSAAQPRVERLLPSPEKPVAVDEVLKRSVPETNAVVTGTAPRGVADPAPGAPVRLTPGDPEPAPLAATPSAQDVAKLPAAPTPAPPAINPQAVQTTPQMTTQPTPAPPPAPKPAPKAATPAPTQTAQASPSPESPAADLSKSYRIQLAASRSEDAVKSEWDRLRRRHVDLLGDLRLQIMRIDLGATKGVFYRLRAGPLADAATAKTLCERLKQRKLGCLVVKPGA